MKSLSPCARPQCFKKNKTVCSEICKELHAYQLYLQHTHDAESQPAIDYADFERARYISPKHNFKFSEDESCMLKTEEE